LFSEQKKGPRSGRGPWAFAATFHRGRRLFLPFLSSGSDLIKGTHVRALVALALASVRASPRRTGPGTSLESAAVPGLDGKVAVVTGASSGIGAATAHALAREGARVIGGARRAELIAAPVEGHELDVTDPASCERFVAETAAHGLDILVNAAGLALGRDPFDESTEEDERTVLETDVNGLIRMTRLCLPHLRDHGHIVNLGSVAGRQAYPNAALYVASKFAVRGFTYALREDLLGRPIRITTVDPGLVQTNFSRVRFRGDEEAARKVYEGVEAMTPEDIADCILFAVTRPPHVNVDEIVVKALAQSSGGRILRKE
jgi:3-hydroxy acid dehydrogenase / malonic semialdehyde reductase